jgi:hypothetical protein
MTCNPEWPEITTRLQPGQNASDVPVIIVWALKIQLQCLLQILCTHFGHLVYMIKIIEFQRRGFLHAHIIAKVSNSLTLIMHNSLINSHLSGSSWTTPRTDWRIDQGWITQK